MAAKECRLDTKILCTVVFLKYLSHLRVVDLAEGRPRNLVRRLLPHRKQCMCATYHVSRVTGDGDDGGGDFLQVKKSKSTWDYLCSASVHVCL